MESSGAKSRYASEIDCVPARGPPGNLVAKQFGDDVAANVGVASFAVGAAGVGDIQDASVGSNGSMSRDASEHGKSSVEHREEGKLIFLEKKIIANATAGAIENHIDYTTDGGRRQHDLDDSDADAIVSKCQT